MGGGVLPLLLLRGHSHHYSSFNLKFVKNWYSNCSKHLDAGFFISFNTVYCQCCICLFVHCWELLSRFKKTKRCLCFTYHHVTIKRIMVNKLLSCAFFFLTSVTKPSISWSDFVVGIQSWTFLATAWVWHIEKVQKLCWNWISSWEISSNPSVYSFFIHPVCIILLLQTLTALWKTK